ncbi:MAG: metallophosphoesterase, partial [Kiritimatiellae bacterium]|nr:metallophosphoesterase [Kiritimatiellia bacterium]
LWFVGDLHGDLLALEAALTYIDAHSELPPTIVFLGDLFDRFNYGLEVVMRVIALIIERPGKILWIAGNHDDGLFFDELNLRFASHVIPAEFVDFLNAHEEYHDFGKFLIGLCQQLPRALFLPDGLFVAHGGCPSFDMNRFGYVIDEIQNLIELEQPDILRSFIWGRIIPDQDDKSGDEVGKNDLIHFMEQAGKLIGFPIKRMLRGHDHCKESRHQFFDYYFPEVPVLTLTTMSAWYLGTENSAPELDRTLRRKSITTPAIARHRSGALPEVFTLDIPVEVISQFHRLEELPEQK